MRIAQGLYEEGSITYMRTDGVQMDESAISAARLAVSNRYDASYVPDKPRHYQTKAKNAQEAHEAIRPTDFAKERAGSADYARLYELIWKRALASQMASARMERTTIELTDGSGQHGLRATGQVVPFPGYLALYEEGSDDTQDEDARRLPRLREGDAPAKKAVDAEQHFTQPPPRFSEASLVKRLEELGIGRPSTYASIIKTLKDRAYVRVEKNRFFAEESGRLVTAFLERFFERYVGYDFTAGLEDELDEVSGGRAQWQAVLDAFWKDFKPRTTEVMDFKPSEVTAALDRIQRNRPLRRDVLLAPSIDGRGSSSRLRGGARVQRIEPPPRGALRRARPLRVRLRGGPTSDEMLDVEFVILGQSHELFEAAGYDVRRWETVKTRGRRRPLRYDGAGRLGVFIASASDIDDLVPILTAYQIEWNKMHERLAARARRIRFSRRRAIR